MMATYGLGIMGSGSGSTTVVVSNEMSANTANLLSADLEASTLGGSVETTLTGDTDATPLTGRTEDIRADVE